MSTPAELVRSCGLPRHEAERLLVIASGRSKVELLSLDAIDAEPAARFEHLVAKRRQGVPLQYLEGTVQFGPLVLRSDPRALIPRPETERLWERVVERVGERPPSVVVDLCTGSGNLALALKHTFPDARVFGADISAEALELAAENGTATGLDVTWRAGDLFEALPHDLVGSVDVLVSNPPYIAVDDFCDLPVDVRDYEPSAALVPGRHGDEALMAIAGAAGKWLAPGGLIGCEIGERQGERMLELFAQFDPVIEQDLAGRDRFVFGGRGFG